MTATTLETSRSDSRAAITVALRALALVVLVVLLGFLVNNYLIFWRDWPGIANLFSHQGWFGLEALRTPLDADAVGRGWLQLLIYLAPIAAAIGYAQLSAGRTLRAEAAFMSAIASYIIRAAFWAVFLVGIVDSVISFLRIEGLLEVIVGQDMTIQLGRSQFRGNFVHLPLLVIAAVIAVFRRTLGFSWLALLVVVAELLIVLTRFIFSYEQAFMGDLVRFWYAALFLFASAYTLIEEGHVRVDVLYTGFSERKKAWVNALGSMLLGVPLCWVIIVLGMAGKATVINSPILAFETSQSGFGLYVKYLMAGFLAVYALSMMVQFLSYFLSNAAELRGEPKEAPEPGGGDHAPRAKA